MQITQLNQTVTLYQKDHNQNIRVWEIVVTDSFLERYDINIQAGIKGGKMTPTVTPITSGSNIGRSNEKSALEQAIFDANTEINKKIKNGYVSDITQVKSKTETLTIKKPSKGFLYHPTGATKSSLTLDKAKLRNKLVGIQRKLDGWRYRIRVNRENCIFYTSSGDITASFPHIEAMLVAGIKLMYLNTGIEEVMLDGEIYNHELGFQATAAACGTKKITPEKQALRDKMQFHLFDICSDDHCNLPYSERVVDLHYFYHKGIIVPVETLPIYANETEIENLFIQFLGEGYEGLIIRNLDSKYEFKKCNQFFKYKPLIDCEFEVVGFNESIQKNTLGSIVLKMPDGRTFDANPKDDLGTDAVKKQIWDNQSEHIGKWATVEFLGYTNDGLPRHPRVKCFRKGKSLD